MMVNCATLTKDDGKQLRCNIHVHIQVQYVGPMAANARAAPAAAATAAPPASGGWMSWLTIPTFRYFLIFKGCQHCIVHMTLDLVDCFT